MNDQPTLKDVAFRFRTPIGTVVVTFVPGDDQVRLVHRRTSRRQDQRATVVLPNPREGDDGCRHYQFTSDARALAARFSQVEGYVRVGTRVAAPAGFFDDGRERPDRTGVVREHWGPDNWPRVEFDDAPGRLETVAPMALEQCR